MKTHWKICEAVGFTIELLGDNSMGFTKLGISPMGFYHMMTIRSRERFNPIIRLLDQSCEHEGEGRLLFYS